MQTNSAQRVKSCRHSFEGISECVGSIHLLQPVLLQTVTNCLLLTLYCGPVAAVR